MSKPGVATAQIIRIQGSENSTIVDLLAVEEPLEIRVGYGSHSQRKQQSVAVTMRTPGNDFELALGFLLTEGIIDDRSQVYAIQYCTELNTIENKENIVRVELQPDVSVDLNKLQRHFYTSSSCGVCGKESIEAIHTVCKRTITPPASLDIDLIKTLPERLRKAQLVFEYTGGLHACALFSSTGELHLLREDVGRHNALDKLAGALAASNLDPSPLILLLSGRASFELIQKAAMMGIPVVCAIGAPSSLAVETAKSFGIQLIGFLKADRMNIYTPHSHIA